MEDCFAVLAALQRGSSILSVPGPGQLDKPGNRAGKILNSLRLHRKHRRFGRSSGFNRYPHDHRNGSFGPVFQRTQYFFRAAGCVVRIEKVKTKNSSSISLCTGNYLRRKRR